MGQRKCMTLDHRVKREICKHNQENPRITNRELLVWAEEKLGAKVHEATIGRVLKRSFALLSNVSGNVNVTAQEVKLVISDDVLIGKAKHLFDIRTKQAIKSDRNSHVPADTARTAQTKFLGKTGCAA
ncbi:unnamed protein product [Calypogeia fissa]